MSKLSTLYTGYIIAWWYFNVSYFAFFFQTKELVKPRTENQQAHMPVKKIIYCTFFIFYKLYYSNTVHFFFISRAIKTKLNRFVLPFVFCFCLSCYNKEDASYDVCIYIYTKIVKDSIMHNIKHYPYIVTVESCYYYFNFEPLGSLAFHTNKIFLKNRRHAKWEANSAMKSNIQLLHNYKL